MVVEVRRHSFTVDEFAKMGEAGIFTEDDRVELIDGEIREMAPIGSLHARNRGPPDRDACRAAEALGHRSSPESGSARSEQRTAARHHHPGLARRLLHRWASQTGGHSAGNRGCGLLPGLRSPRKSAAICPVDGPRGVGRRSGVRGREGVCAAGAVGPTRKSGWRPGARRSCPQAWKGCVSRWTRSSGPWRSPSFFTSAGCPRTLPTPNGRRALCYTLRGPSRADSR